MKSGAGLILSALLFSAFSLCAQAAEPDPEARYQVLLTIAKAGQSVDWQALRFAYADRPNFSVFGDGQQVLRKQMFDALEVKDYAGALKAAQQIIDADFVDADAHLIVFICDQALGHPQDGLMDRYIGAALIHSMETGDGKTPATALTVIRVDEEYAYLRVHGLHPHDQALIRDGGHSYDLLNAVDESGQKHSFYFLIDRVLSDEMKALRPR